MIACEGNSRFVMTQIFSKPIVVVLMLSSIFGFTPSGRSAGTQSLVDGNTAFALDLYGQLKNRPEPANSKVSN